MIMRQGGVWHAEQNVHWRLLQQAMLEQEWGREPARPRTAREEECRLVESFRGLFGESRGEKNALTQKFLNQELRLRISSAMCKRRVSRRVQSSIVYITCKPERDTLLEPNTSGRLYEDACLYWMNCVAVVGEKKTIFPSPFWVLN